MSTRRNTPNRSGIILAFSTLVVGVIIGVIVKDFPLITFKHEVDLGMLATIIGLFLTVYIMPFIVEKRLSNTTNISGIIVQDLDAILVNVEHLRSQFNELSPSRKVTEKQFRSIVGTFKSVSAALYALHEQASGRGRLIEMKDEVYDKFYTPAYDTCTGTLMYNRKIDEQTLMNAQSTLNMLAMAIRKFMSTFHTYIS